jgi:hypothetical protein
MTDYWPDFGKGKFERTPPRTFLREQAEALTRRTKGVLEGLVTTSTQGNFFLQSLYVVVPSLENYSYQLLLVVHPVQYYPLDLRALVQDRTIVCQTEEQFKDALREVLQSEQTKRVLEALLGQVELPEEETSSPATP